MLWVYCYSSGLSSCSDHMINNISKTDFIISDFWKNVSVVVIKSLSIGSNCKLKSINHRIFYQQVVSQSHPIDCKSLLARFHLSRLIRLIEIGCMAVDRMQHCFQREEEEKTPSLHTMTASDTTKTAIIVSEFH